MNLCNHNHDEICFDDRKCPLCLKQGELDEAQSKIEDMTNEIAELKKVIDELENKE